MRWIGLFLLMAAPLRGAQLEDFLRWLPENTESLVVAARPFQIPMPDSDHASDDHIAVGDFLKVVALGALEGCPVLEEALAGRTAEFALTAIPAHDGRRDLTSGVTIIELSQPLGQDLAMLPRYQSAAESFDEKIYTFGQPPRSLKAKFFVAHVNPATLILATDLGLIRTVLTKRRQPGHSGVTKFREWSFVDPRAPFYALRHNSSAAQDDEEAISFVLNWFPGLATQRLLLLTGELDAAALNRQFGKDDDDDGVSANLHRISIDTLAIDFQLSSARANSWLGFVIWTALGLEMCRKEAVPAPAPPKPF